MSLTAILGYYWAFVAVVWILCKLRLLPVPVMRMWFTAVIITQMCLMAVLTMFIDHLKYVGVPVKITQTLCCLVCRCTFWVVVRFNPQAKIHIDETEQQWSKIPNRTVVASNHTSFWDVFIFTGCAPMSYIHNCRTLMQASLRKLPVMGGMFARVGHFPVYFKSDADGHYSVDKERQAVVMEKVKEHFDNGARMILYPEGGINKTDTRTLMPFRHGSFSLILEQKVPVYYFLMVGNEVTWPSKSAIGGYPADIYCSMHHYPIDFTREDLTVKELVEGLEKAMQEKLDILHARRSNETTNKN